MVKLYLKEIITKLGRLRILCDDNFIIRLLFENDNLMNILNKMKVCSSDVEYCKDNQLAVKCGEELYAYLDGKLKAFTVKPTFNGTVFENKVWNLLSEVPYGHTVSYAALADRCGIRGARAIGGALGRNPVPVIIPCHRVIKSQGEPGGYRGGTDMKIILLKTEKAVFNFNVPGLNPPPFRRAAFSKLTM